VPKVISLEVVPGYQATLPLLTTWGSAEKPLDKGISAVILTVVNSLK
jgi:hypothetical protein